MSFTSKNAALDLTFRKLHEVHDAFLRIRVTYGLGGYQASYTADKFCSRLLNADDSGARRLGG